MLRVPAGLLLGLLCLGGCREPQPDPRPHVLLIVMDTARRDRLSSYGYARQTTPHLDRIAAEGTLYENCVTPGPWTLPSHASLFTGLFPRDHNTNCENRTLPGYFTTLAEVLASAGYQTAGFSNNVWLSKKSGLQQGFETFDEVWRDRLGADAGAALTNQRVLAWLDARTDPRRPFFAFINYFEPHLPYRPPAPYDRAFVSPEVDNEELAVLRSWKHPRELGYILGVPGMEVSPRQFELLERQYDGEMAYLDWHIGQLIEGFRTRGILDDTVLVVTSDHGEHFGDHQLMDHKMSVYDVLLRVPLIVRYPPRVPAGVRVASQVQTLDLFPSILDLCGLAAPASAGLLLDPVDPPDRPYTFAELDNPGVFLEVMHSVFPGVDTRRFERELTAVRGRRHKLIWASDGRHELYDIVADPTESTDIAGDHPEIVERLQGILREYESGRQPVAN